MVLLPAEAATWSIDRRRDILLHELAHVRRLDCLTQTIARAACAVYWFHPLAWVAAASHADRARARLRRRRARWPVRRASDYAGHLLEVARGLRAPRATALAALAMARPSQIEGRLLAILDPARRRRGPGRGTAAVALLVAVVALVPLATLHLGGRANTSTALAAAASKADDPPTGNRAARMTLTGRVLDPQGKPVPDAAVLVIVRSKYASRPLFERSGAGAMTAHEGRCDGSGRFRIELPRTTSARQYGLTLMALAPGYGTGWTDLDPDADPAVADVALRPELIVRGRLFNVNGEPARGVALRIESLISVVGGKLSASVFRPDFERLQRRDLPAWPGPSISDEQGRFTLRGLSRDLLCPLLVEDPRFALPYTMIQTAENIDPRDPSRATPRSRYPGPIRSPFRSPWSRPKRSSGE